MVAQVKNRQESSRPLPCTQKASSAAPQGRRVVVSPLDFRGTNTLSFSPPGSKQRHNKLWRQQSQDSLPPNVDGSGGPSDFLLESLEVDLDLPCPSPRLDDPLSQETAGCHDCFRRLSDSLPGAQEAFFQVEDLEREVLLEEEAEAAVELPFLKFVERLKRPETVQGPGLDEKVAKRKPEAGLPKEGAGPRRVASEEGAAPEEKPLERWKRRSSAQEEGGSRLNWENLNNNNSKRSCPEDFEVRLGPEPCRWEGQSAGRGSGRVCSGELCFSFPAHPSSFRGAGASLQGGAFI